MLPSLAQMTVHPPEPPQRPRQPQPCLATLAVRQAPRQCRSQVVMLLLQPSQPLSLPWALQFRLCLLRQRQAIDCVPLLQRGELIRNRISPSGEASFELWVEGSSASTREHPRNCSR